MISMFPMFSVRYKITMCFNLFSEIIFVSISHSLVSDQRPRGRPSSLFGGADGGGVGEGRGGVYL